MSEFYPIRDLPKKSDFNSKDTLVIFGEVFERGYVNGLIQEAQRVGMKVIYSTVGRRDENGNLRTLNEAELSEKNQSPIINVPLEAGFDLEPMSDDGRSLTDHLKTIKTKTWKEFDLPQSHINTAIESGRVRFKKNVKLYLDELVDLLPSEGNVIFAHTMAGGIPKSKIVFSLMNKILKGFGDRYTSSKEFVNSNMGQMCEKNFKEVTGETLQTLLTLTSDLRESLASSGRKVSYVAYGYHGTEVQMRGEYKWYSYTPYIQGRAKLHLESISKKAFDEGVTCCVFNVPEILTNSSGIFQGIELGMYPLLESLYPHIKDKPELQKLFSDIEGKLKPESSLEELFKNTQEYFTQNSILSPLKFETWPQDNQRSVMDTMREYSQKNIEAHVNQKDIVIFPISEVIFKACGEIILHSCGTPEKHMQWVGHDVILKATLERDH